MKNKAFLLSRTIWTAILTVIVVLGQPIWDYIQTNEWHDLTPAKVAVLVIGLIVMIGRLIQSNLTQFPWLTPVAGGIMIVVSIGEMIYNGIAMGTSWIQIVIAICMFFLNKPESNIVGFINAPKQLPESLPDAS